MAIMIRSICERCRRTTLVAGWTDHDGLGGSWLCVSCTRAMGSQSPTPDYPWGLVLAQSVALVVCALWILFLSANR